MNKKIKELQDSIRRVTKAIEEVMKEQGIPKDQIEKVLRELQFHETESYLANCENFLRDWKDGQTKIQLDPNSDINIKSLKEHG